jgi:hypothetical protein
LTAFSSQSRLQPFDVIVRGRTFVRIAMGTLCVLLTLGAPKPALAICQGGQKLQDFAGKQVVLAHDALFFRTPSIELDLDGSPSTYGTRDQGLDHICNGLGPLEPQDCRGKIKPQKCLAACETAFRNWVKHGNDDPKTLAKFMCSIGLGGGHCSKPDVRLQASPRQAWFVSETSVRVVPPAGAAITDWVKTQPAQLDSLSIAYFVIPGGFRAGPWDATPGDLGAVMDGPTGTPVPFIVGDTGGALNEGSAALLAALQGLATLPTKTLTSALGEPVERMKGAKDGGFRIVIFRHTAPLLPNDQRGDLLVLDKSAAELPGWIRDTVTGKLQEIGGPARIVACTAS